MTESLNEESIKMKQIEELSFENRVFRKFTQNINGLNELMLFMFTHGLLGKNDNGSNQCHYHDIMRGLNILSLECAQNLKQ